MTRVLVTGATGFIGPHLIDALLASGTEVTCLVRNPARAQDLAARGAQIIAGDLENPESLAPAVAQVDEVYHLAGLIKALRSVDLMRVNQGGAANLARACAAKSTPPVLVLVSSLAAAGPSTPGHVRTEREPAAPVSAYGRSKRAGEIAAIEVADRVPLSIVRPPIVFGPGDINLYWLFKPIAQLGVHLIGGPRQQRVSLIDARDLSQLLISVARNGSRVATTNAQANDGQGFYFAADDERPTFVELGHMMSQALGRNHVRMLRMPALGTWLLGVGGEIYGHVRRDPFIMNRDKAREALAGDWVCDPARARNELGFSPAAGVDQRFAETVAWYREHGWLR